MKKIAIYTAVIGGYDIIRQPIVVDDRFDYYLFTDYRDADFIGVWKILPIPYSNSDNKLVSSYIKTHPHILLSDYEATLWMDSSILILDNFIYEKAWSALKNSINVSTVKHPLRDCVYEEAYIILNKGYEDENKIYNWCHKLLQERYPQHNGLSETGILFRRNHDCVNSFNNQWWSFLSTYVKRDQLIFNYLASINEMNIDKILPLGESCWHSDHVKYIPHVYGTKKKIVKRNVMSAMLSRFRITSNKDKFWTSLFLLLWKFPFYKKWVAAIIQLPIIAVQLPFVLFEHKILKLNER